MSSKAAYLSKYYSNEEAGVSDDDNDSRQKANKKKSKKTKKERKRDTKKAETHVHDDDEDNIATMNKNSGSAGNDGDEESDAEGDGPLVIDDGCGCYGSNDNQDRHLEENDNLIRTKSKHDDHGLSPEESLRETKGKRRRYDSDSDSKSYGGDSKRSSNSDSKENKKRKRYDSDSSESATKKKRYDSTSEEEDRNNPKERRKRYDSDTDSSSKSGGVKAKRIDDDESKNNSDSNSDVDSTGRQRKMASGHAAGLQRAQDFSKAEKEIQAKRKLEASALVDEHGMGDTVYRDAHGRKQKQIPEQEEKTTLSKEQLQQQLFLLNQGKRQIQAQKEKQIYEEKLSRSGFARGIEDNDLEEWKKQQVREGDPMAAKASSATTRKDDNKSRGHSQKTTYKGPPAPPNRFQIKPGYRWDGNHRGNGFENKLLAKRFGQEMEKEKAYHWSTADM